MQIFQNHVRSELYKFTGKMCGYLDLSALHKRAWMSMYCAQKPRIVRARVPRREAHNVVSYERHEVGWRLSIWGGRFKPGLVNLRREVHMWNEGNSVNNFGREGFQILFSYIFILFRKFHKRRFFFSSFFFKSLSHSHFLLHFVNIGNPSMILLICYGSLKTSVASARSAT